MYYFLNTDIQYEKVIISSQPDRTLKIIKSIIFRSPALDWGCYFQQQNKDRFFVQIKNRILWKAVKHIVFSRYCFILLETLVE